MEIKHVKTGNEAREILLSEKRALISFKNLNPEEILDLDTIIVMEDSNRLFAVDKKNNFYSGKIEDELLEIGGCIIEKNKIEGL